MESLKNNTPSSGSEQKIDEYVKRINDGESKDSIFQGLPESFKSGIEKRLSEQVEEPEQGSDEIPPQYQGLDSETLDLIWTIPEYIDTEKTKEEKAKKARVLAVLRAEESAKAVRAEWQEARQKRMEELKQQLGIPKPSENNGSQEENTRTLKPEELPTLSIEARKRLSGWEASYELAKIAKQQGIDLSTISREEYADFAIQNSLAIDDGQLRAAPWQRMGTSPEEILLMIKEKRLQINEETKKAFEKFSIEMTNLASKPQNERWLSNEIRVLSGTAETVSWLHFAINNAESADKGDTYKSYISLKDPNLFSKETILSFMEKLRDAGYQGQLKTFQDLSFQGINLNDQIVMHGNTQADAELALQVAEQFFGTDIDKKSVGKDELVDGKEKSYSQILAQRIAEAVNPPNPNN